MQIKIYYEETRRYVRTVDVVAPGNLADLDYAVSGVLADDRSFSPAYLIDSDSRYTDWKIVGETER